MNIRIATKDDRDDVLQLLNQLGEVVNARVSKDPDNIRAHIVGVENYDNAMKRDDRKIFVLELGNKIIAVATLFIMTNFITGKKFAHLDDFVVDIKHRKKGYGTELLEFVKEYSKKHNILQLELTSSLSLVEAHRFYEKRGGRFTRKVISFSL